MPLKRKIIEIGNSRAVVIPADWLKYREEKQGAPITFVLMEVNKVITISIEEPDEQSDLPEVRSN